MDTGDEKRTARILLCQQELRPFLQIRGLLYYFTTLLIYYNYLVNQSCDPFANPRSTPKP